MFNAVYNETRGPLAKYVEKTVEWNLAQDIIQQSFVKLWERMEAGETIRCPIAWLKKAAHNIICDTKKSLYNSVVKTNSIFETMEAKSPVEKDEKLTAALNSLSKGHRDLLIRYYFNQETHEEIANSLGIRRDAVHMRLHRARGKLAAILPWEGY